MLIMKKYIVNYYRFEKKIWKLEFVEETILKYPLWYIEDSVVSIIEKI